MDHYVGKEVEIVYLDRQGNVTQRRIIIRSIRDGIVNATCLYESKAWRPFRIENILILALRSQYTRQHGRSR